MLAEHVVGVAGRVRSKVESEGDTGGCTEEVLCEWMVDRQFMFTSILLGN